MEPRGRGRGYGRSRGQAQAAGAGGQQQRPGGQQQRPGGQQQQRAPQQPAPQAGLPPAWVRPAQPGQAWPRPQMGTQQPPQAQGTVAGRGVRSDPDAVAGAPVTSEHTVTGSGDAGNNAPRGGNVRGRVVNRREIIYNTRPSQMTSKKGKSGVPVELTANYLPLIKNEKWCLYQYRVDMQPEVDHTGKKKSLMRTGVRDHIQGGYLFDGTMLFTPNRINPDPLEVFVQDEGGENIRITLRLVGDLEWGDHHYLQLFNILVRKCLTLMGLQLVGRNYYMPDSKITLNEHRIQLWPGYFTSMRQHEQTILLNIDLQFKFMRTDTVYDMLMECDSGNVKKEFHSKIIGTVVLTTYNNKTYMIDDIDFEKTPASTFTMRDGSEISFEQYFAQKYNIRIRVRNQPLLVSRSKPREIRSGMPETVVLVPELCQLTGLTDKQRENFHLMKALGTYTKVGPDGRQKKLKEFITKLHSNKEVAAEFRRYDLGVGTDLVRMQGRVLPMESMVAGENIRYDAGHEADWTRDVRSKPMVVMGKMNKLAVVCPTRVKGPTSDFMQTLVKCAQGMRWNLSNYKIFEIRDDRSATYLEEIERIISSVSPTMIMVVLSNNSQDRYSACKKKCYVDRAVPTQMIVARNLTSKGVMSIATKVAIQMNCKIGGAPWSVSIPLKNLMVVGYDVCRDTANKKRSFAGIVASLNRNMTHYYSAAFEHKMEEELSDNFATFMVIACKNYKDENGVYPERILIYRDGVGDGQIPYVKEHEVANIRRKLTETIYPNNDLKMAFVVVSKRTNTRIFKGALNPPPGTVVDDVITLPERYDFFLVSQCVRQGSVAPTNYNIIDGDIGLMPDQMQILTHKMTHMYYNWSGTVRVPAPCQYAHKLAFLVSQNMHRPAHPDLSNLLYYL